MLPCRECSCHTGSVAVWPTVVAVFREGKRLRSSWGHLTFSFLPSPSLPPPSPPSPSLPGSWITQLPSCEDILIILN